MEEIGLERNEETAGDRQYSQPVQQPNYPPPQYPPSRGGQTNIANMILKNPIYIGLGIAISVFLLWLGLLFQTLAIGSTDSGQIKTLLQISIIIYNLGIAGLIILLFYIGLGRGDYPQWVRAVLILGAVLLILWGFTSLFSILSMMNNLPSFRILIL